MSKKVPAQSGRKQATGGNAARAPMKGPYKMFSPKPEKYGTRPSMPGKPYPSKPDKNHPEWPK